MKARKRGTRPRPDAARRIPASQLPLAQGLVLFAAVILHISSLRLPFFADDYLFLDQVRHQSFLHLWRLHDPLGNFWRPVGRQAYFWLVSRAGESPAVAHLINLGLFVLILLLLMLVVRRLAGARAAVIATAFLALNYAADSPIEWASGSQDLIAVSAAVGALSLILSGRRWWAAALLGLGLLSKETIVLTPLIAILLARRDGEPWWHSIRRCWPLMAALGVWGIAWLMVMQGRSGGTIRFTADAVPAALVHFVQVVLGAEWSGAAPNLKIGLGAALALVLVVLATGLSFKIPRTSSVEPVGRSLRDQYLVGVPWTMLGALPVAVAVHIWSAYYYLFALCGVAIVLGITLARWRPWAACLMIAVLGLGSSWGRHVPGFSTAEGNWNTVSHFNPFYFARSMHWSAAYLTHLRRARPELPRHSTLYFAGTPAFAAWQIADGALVRWAYRDSTLRSYYLSNFRLEHARRGPVLFFFASGDSLFEVPSDPEGFRRIAVTQVLSEHFWVARDVLLLASEGTQLDRVGAYWMAWMAFAENDTATAYRALRKAGCDPSSADARDALDAVGVLASGDTIEAIARLRVAIQRHALAPEPHAVLADVLLAKAPVSPSGVFEALAARVLAPNDPWVWRRWARVQAMQAHPQEAYASLQRYLVLAGREGMHDAEAVRLLEILRQSLPGGSRAQDALRQLPAGRNP
jgi:hypothetical protein